MATAGETEASPPTDASWESGGGGDDEMKQALPELESSPQNGGGGLSIAEPGGGAGPEETAAASAAPSVSHEQTQDSSEAGAAAVPKGPEEPERPVRRSFQIPRKSREKKALFQPLTPGSREFEDVLNILHSSYLEPTSVTNFNYKRACLIHNELLEKEFTEKRRELKFDGRLDKELSESYAFLMVDRYQVQSICEKGLQVGQSKITILGSPSMGIYLSKYADLLQANPLEAGAVGDVVIFKIMKGKIKSLESILNKSALDPTPKHECHVSKNANRVTSLLAYRAYELTQYYFYEYIFDELRRRPRHVCPYAVVSFTYKDDIQTPKFVPSSRSNSFNADRNTDKFNYTLWKGQLLNKGKLLCYISLRSTTRAFLPIKLPEKLDVETVMSIDHLKQKIPPALFYKETYLGPSEVLKNGMYCSLYEVVEKTRIGSNMESLLQKLEKEKLVLVKPLGDRGYLFLLSPCQMVSPYEHQTAKSRVLHALFLFQEPRGIVTSQKGSTNAAPQKRHESMTDVLKITQFLQFALIQCRKEFKNMNTINFHSVVEKYVNEFFKRGFGSESLQPIGSLGHDADLRPQQQDTSNSGVADIHRLFNWLSETLANARHSDASLTDTVNKALGLNTDDAYEELRQKHEYELNSPADKKEYEQPTCAKIENVHFKGTQSPLLEIDTSLLKYPVAVSTSEVGTDHKLHLKEDPNLISMNNFEDCSLCPTVPIEHGFRRQSKSNDVEETEIHWKLIPITGGNARSPEDQLGKHGEKQTPGMKSPEEQLVCLQPQEAFPNDPRVISRQRSSDYQFPSSPFTDTLKGTTEDDVLTGQVVTVEEQCVPAAEPPTMSETTERTVLGEYSLFSRKIEEILKQKNVSYVSRISTPIFSTQEKMKRLSEFIYSKTSKAGVQEFVDGLHEKLNTIIIKASAKGGNLPPVSPNDSGTKIALNPLGKPVIPISSSDFNNKQLLEPLCSDPLKDTNSSEQHSSSSLGLTEVEVNQPHHATELMVTSDHTVPGDIVREPVEKETTKSPSDVNISAQPALSNFISQLEPEVFNSLVKIMKDVQKNTVKFYIHEEEESVLCKEIKEYLIKLGNTECHPEQFLERRSKLDKLLIIIQNEDIAGFIHKVPGLVTLKKLPCVSFAGVDSLDDVKNHTYNELFVSGGFIVSDESILNPEVITIENLKNFLTFLEELSTPEGKWQWKVHCKFQKKLKELGRLNAKALSLLTLLNVYQKKHLVEILSYHNCDSQTRNAPELDCLIRLQAQNVQQRHIVFLTEKNIKMISSYTDNGIVVATTEDFMQNFKNLVGYHNSITEENLPLLGANENLESQSALLENDEKDEEDMSLDSGDEISQIEVCSNFHSEILAKETKGSRGTDQNKNIQIELQSSLDVQKSLLEDKTCQIDSEERASVALVCSEGENSSSTEQDAYSSFQVYHSQLHMSHQFSHFNVLTHQTFLGTPYALSSSQSQESENYFLSAYTQSLDRDKSPSPLSWGKSDSSRPFSKEK
ncbi:protein TASOR isoform X6 [Panthera pardus]|uniref:Protein TASOR isoform X6 n=1 Tax=Panthera pardus TaxID=9691 RepID=A0A9W2V4W8_PANPR|nr:protein TASOR isoform X6 [Panthera pardus]XP_060487327.1 protein TASOR isoform X7 [Panthera onca]